MVPAADGGSFHTGKPGLRKLLGDLEADVMEAVWSHGDATIMNVMARSKVDCNGAPTVSGMAMSATVAATTPTE